jgi:Cu+-exporting ATPase
MAKREQYMVSGMSCAACAARIEKSLKKLEGVLEATVNFATEKVNGTLITKQIAKK